MGVLKSARTCRRTSQNSVRSGASSPCPGSSNNSSLGAPSSARDGAALALSAGYFVRTPSGGVDQTEAFEHFVHPAMTFQARPALGRKLQILAQRHVREQRVVLKHVAAIAGSRRQADARRTVKENFVIEQDASVVGTHEARDQIQCERFSRSAGSEQNRDAGGGLKFELEGERGRIGPSGKSLAEPGADHIYVIMSRAGSGGWPASGSAARRPRSPGPACAPPWCSRLRRRRKSRPRPSVCGREYCPPP